MRIKVEGVERRMGGEGADCFLDFYDAFLFACSVLNWKKFLTFQIAIIEFTKNWKYYEAELQFYFFKLQ